MYKVKVENLNQFEVALDSNKVSEIILARDSFAEIKLPSLVSEIKKTGKTAWILMERISRYEENMKTVNKTNASPFDLRTSTDKIYDIENLDGIIIENLDSFAYMLRRINKAANKKLMVEINYTMNCYNSETKLVLEKLYNDKRENASNIPLLFTAPVELNIYELSDVGYDTLILYSYIDTMVSANCLRKNLSANGEELNKKNVKTVVNNKEYSSSNPCDSLCKHRFDFDYVQDFSSYIIDRKGKKLYYKTYCKYCYNKIFNTEPLFLLDKISEIESIYNKHLKKVSSLNENMNLLKYRIDFSFENKEEVKNILAMKSVESFTRGHYKNGIK